MGYRKIPNLYKDTTIIEVFKEVYATEKIHGTSAHIAFNEGQLNFYSGGVPHADFIQIFNHSELQESFAKIGHPQIVIFGEAYGGKCQRMGAVYGPDLRFIAFEVKIGEHWLDVEKAAGVVGRMGLEFVHWIKGPATVEFVDKWRDAPSELAIRRGMGNTHNREGIVIRPPVEVKLNNGERLMAKHKHPSFRETSTPREVDPNKQKVLSQANSVAEEYVVPMRLDHVIDKYIAKMQQADPDFRIDMKDTSNVIRLMIDDIKTEEGDVIEWSKSVQTAIGKKTAQMLKHRIMEIRSS